MVPHERSEGARSRTGARVTAVQREIGRKNRESKAIDTVDDGRVAVAAATQGDYARPIAGRQRGPHDPRDAAEAH